MGKQLSKKLKGIGERRRVINRNVTWVVVIKSNLNLVKVISEWYREKASLQTSAPGQVYSMVGLLWSVQSLCRSAQLSTPGKNADKILKTMLQNDEKKCAEESFNFIVGFPFSFVRQKTLFGSIEAEK